MKNYFRQSEFHKKNVNPPYSVRTKIQRIIRILNPVRHDLKASVIVSEQSGYRPLEQELSNGRDGTSEHVFRGEGAVDVTSRKFLRLFKALIKSDFTRICIYPSKKFIHCDFKGNKKAVFFSGSNHKWIRLPKIFWGG